VDEPPVFEGHPTTILILDGEPREFTVCASCEKLPPVLFYAGDRWLCRECRVPIGGEMTTSGGERG